MHRTLSPLCVVLALWGCATDPASAPTHGDAGTPDGSVVTDASDASDVGDAPSVVTDTGVDVQRILPACVHDPRVQMYAPGLGQTGAHGLVHVQLASMDPSADVTDNYQWTVTVTDATGQPVDGATLVAHPFMPDHGHGTSVIPTVTALGGGRYSVANVYLFMAGVWTVTFTATLMDGHTDTAVFTVCIGDG